MTVGRTSANGVEHILEVLVRGDEERRRVRENVLREAEQIEAREARQLDIRDDDVPFAASSHRSPAEPVSTGTTW
jgi:hypothetical protein